VRRPMILQLQRHPTWPLHQHLLAAAAHRSYSRSTFSGYFKVVCEVTLFAEVFLPSFRSHDAKSEYADVIYFGLR